MVIRRSIKLEDHWLKDSMVSAIIVLTHDSKFVDLISIVFSELAVETGQDLKKINFRDQSWLGLKTRSRKYIL